MERIDFIKKGISFMGMALIAPALLAKNNDGKNTACSVTNTETAGPFPTISPASLLRSNITGDRTGVPFTINIVVKNVNDNCHVLAGVLVDIWHCDKDGNYSQYGGSQMQPTDYTSNHFLRGRQVTDTNGLVSYTSVFPGWYQGRATHIHVHIYTAGGSSLLITQIAFPEGATSAVNTVNAATAYGYTKGMTGYTYNASDNVFSDGTANEMASISGSLAAGYVLDWEVFVAAPLGTGIQETATEAPFRIRQNYPNPCREYTQIPLTLRLPADVRTSISDLQGREIRKFITGQLGAGEQVLDLDLSGLSEGRYIYTVKVNTPQGAFRQSGLLIKQ
jgi:protocatechuate 3,4-dioxygenase beta subunit